MDVPEQTINSFFQQAVISDFQRDYNLRVQSIIFDGGLELGPEQMIYARTAKLPSRDIVEQTVKYAGQDFHVPGSSKFPGSEAYSIEFYCPEDSSLREAFLNESVRTFGNVFGIAGSGQNGGSIASPNSRITLLQLDKNLDAIYKYELIGCNIRSVGELEYSIADGEGAVRTFSVTIAYHFFIRSAMGENLVTPDNI